MLTENPEPGSVWFPTEPIVKTSTAYAKKKRGRPARGKDKRRVVMFSLPPNLAEWVESFRDQKSHKMETIVRRAMQETSADPPERYCDACRRKLEGMDFESDLPTMGPEARI